MPTPNQSQSSQHHQSPVQPPSNRPQSASAPQPASPAASEEQEAQAISAASDSVTLSGDEYDLFKALIRREAARSLAGDAQKPVVAAAVAATATDPDAPDPATGFRASDRVTVLHGYGKVAATYTESINGPSHAMYKKVGGVIKDVLYSDARYWRERFGSAYLHILPRDATEKDYIRASGMRHTPLPELIAQLDALDVSDLISAWSEEKAASFAERIAEALQERHEGPKRRLSPAIAVAVAGSTPAATPGE